MNIPMNSDIKLVFRIDSDAPIAFQKLWKTCMSNFENEFESLNGIRPLLTEWLYYCQLPQNKILPYLDRYEGGIGGDNNQINKQIRPLCDPQQDCRIREDELVLYVLNTDTEIWCYDELLDLIQALCKVFEKQINSIGGIHGYIKIAN